MDVMDQATKEWRPYEGRKRWALDKFRYALLPPAISKRHFFFAKLNLVGLSFFEAIIALALLAAVVILGWQQRTSEASTSGNVAQVLWIPLFLFITYRSITTWLFGISFERGMFWHGFFALIATGYGIWHGAASLWWAELDDDSPGPQKRGLNMFTEGEYVYECITGALASLFMLLLVLTSFHPIRRIARRAWLWSHHIFVVPAVIFSVLHGAPAVLGGLAIYLVDRLFGYIYQARFKYQQMGYKGKAEVLPSGLVRLSFPRLMSFQAGQYLCIGIPSVSLFEFHAFTIASAPSDEELVLLVKGDGRWTRKLARTVAHESATMNSRVVGMKALLHGPVGSVALDWESSQYKAFVLVGGGIGITPMMTMYRHLAEQKRRGREIVLCRLIWSSRERQVVEDCIESQRRSRGYHSDNGTTSEEEEEGGRRTRGGDGYDEEQAGCRGAVSGFDARIYITRGGGAGTEEKRVSCDEVLQRVEWTEGRRADLKTVFEEVGAEVARRGAGRVAVMACGPGPLTVAAVREAGRASKGQTRFDVHLEHFY